MLEKLIYAGVVFMGFSAIMNPIAAVSIFLTMTHQESDEKAKKIALQATITAFSIVVFFVLAGHFLLNLFGVTFTALRLTGGIVVAIIGYEMLQGKQSSFNRPAEATDAEEISLAITPLGIPLLAGPGVIITAMNFATGGFANIIITIVAFAILCLITYFVFISGKQIKKILGANALNVITRMIGLILAVIGIQMFIDGIYSAVKEFQFIKYF